MLGMSRKEKLAASADSVAARQALQRKLDVFRAQLAEMSHKPLFVTVKIDGAAVQKKIVKRKPEDGDDGNSAAARH